MTETTDKVAIVTGASRGIGAAVAERLARDGFTVVINYSGDAAPAEARPAYRDLPVAGPLYGLERSNAAECLVSAGCSYITLRGCFPSPIRGQSP